MKIWILDCDVNYFENLAWGKDENDIDLNFIKSFDGTPKEKEWKPLEFKCMYHNRKFANTLGLSAHIPVFDKNAVNELRDYLEGNAEILPISCEGKKFYIINVTNVMDCIDYEASEYKTFRDGVRIMRFTKYAFLRDKIENVHIFKIKDEPLRSPFVSDAFRQKILDSNLIGFKFELVWDSDEN